MKKKQRNRTLFNYYIIQGTPREYEDERLILLYLPTTYTVHAIENSGG